MKTLIGIIVLLILVAGGYYFFMQPTAESPNTLGTPAPGNEGNYPEPNSKINIDVICEGALAYMSFPAGVEADVWVQECKEGKHPSAIEQWKEMNGITDDRAI